MSRGSRQVSCSGSLALAACSGVLSHRNAAVGLMYILGGTAAAAVAAAAAAWLQQLLYGCSVNE